MRRLTYILAASIVGMLISGCDGTFQKRIVQPTDTFEMRKPVEEHTKSGPATTRVSKTETQTQQEPAEAQELRKYQKILMEFASHEYARPAAPVTQPTTAPATQVKIQIESAIIEVKTRGPATTTSTTRQSAMTSTPPVENSKVDQGSESKKHEGAKIIGYDRANVDQDGSISGFDYVVSVVDKYRAMIFYSFSCICAVATLFFLWQKQARLAIYSGIGIVVFAVLPQVTGPLAWLAFGVACLGVVAGIVYGLKREWYKRQAEGATNLEQEARDAILKGDHATAARKQDAAIAKWRTIDSLYNRLWNSKRK